MENVERLIMNADGGCRNNGKPEAIGSWAFNMKYKEHYKESYLAFGKGEGATNNRMELLALIEGFDQVKNVSIPITVRQDSQYVLNGITKWIHGWKKNGWKTSAKKPVKNVDLWKRLDAQMERFGGFADIKFEHVYGHNGDEGNERVDYLCNLAMDELEGR